MRKAKRKSRRQRLSKPQFELVLRDLGACLSAQSWVHNHSKKGARYIWEKCQRDDWLQWLAEKALDLDKDKLYDAIDRVGRPFEAKLDKLYEKDWTPQIDEQLAATELAQEAAQLRFVREYAPWEKIETRLLSMLRTSGQL
jgi:hypothetical protein